MDFKRNHVKPCTSQVKITVTSGKCDIHILDMSTGLSVAHLAEHVVSGSMDGGVGEVNKKTGEVTFDPANKVS